ncbi:MAG: hypothetical protein WCA82_16060 [Jiangellales bacterium]
MTTYATSAAVAERIPGAGLVTVDSGSHVMLGQTERMPTDVPSS